MHGIRALGVAAVVWWISEAQHPISLVSWATELDLDFPCQWNLCRFPMYPYNLLDKRRMKYLGDEIMRNFWGYNLHLMNQSSSYCYLHLYWYLFIYKTDNRNESILKNRILSVPGWGYPNVGMFRFGWVAFGFMGGELSNWNCRKFYKNEIGQNYLSDAWNLIIKVILDICGSHY